MAASVVSRENEAAAGEATPPATKAGPAAARLPLASLQLHPLLQKLPPVPPLELPGGGAATAGPGHPLVANKEKVVLAGREVMAAANARGETEVEAVLIDVRPDEEVKQDYAASTFPRPCGCVRSSQPCV
jgi:hypothetical protein